MPENVATEGAPSPEVSIKRMLQAVAEGLNDGSKLLVETKVQVLNASGEVRVAGPLVSVARTEISLDGDREIVAPVLLDTGEFRVPEAVYALHERHVAEALAYRKELLGLLVEFVRGRRV